MQLITSASDGLVKLWNIKDEECIKTLDNHEDKVCLMGLLCRCSTDLQIWALAISKDEKTIVSAGADSVATFWEDSSEVEQAEKNDALIKAVQRWVFTRGYCLVLKLYPVFTQKSGTSEKEFTE